MRPLLIDQKVRDDAARLVAFAEANIVDAARVDRVRRKVERPPGDDPRHAITVPMEFRVVFSVDELPNGLARHLSVSIPKVGRLPMPEAIMMLLPLFDMAEFGMCVVWVEGVPDGLGAINVLCGDGRASGQAGAFAALPPGSPMLAQGQKCAGCGRHFVAGDRTGLFRAGSGMPRPDALSVDVGIAHFDCLAPGLAGAEPREAAVR